MKPDLLTTIAGVIPAVFVLLKVSGLPVTDEMQQAVSTIALLVVAYYVGKPAPVRV